MTTGTRYFIVTSLLVLTVGVVTGLVAYYVGFPVTLQSNRLLEELRYLPRDASVVAYANVREVMDSELRPKLRRAMPGPSEGQRDFQNQTGINIETDIDRVVASLDPRGGGTEGGGIVLARGRFDDRKIEALMRDHGGRADEYKGKRLVVAPARPDRPGRNDSFALAFIEPGLVALGSVAMVRKAIDLQESGENVTANDELMERVRSLDGNAWAVGRLDALGANTRLPEQVARQLPAITWFSANGRVDGGIRGVVQADTRDEEAANNLRDVIRGFMALAKLQAGSKPEFQAMMQSLELGGTGKTVALTFSVPGEVFDALGDTPTPR